MLSLLNPENKKTSYTLQLYEQSVNNLVSNNVKFLSYCAEQLTKNFMVNSLDQITALTLTDNVISGTFLSNIGNITLLIQRFNNVVSLKIQPPGATGFTTVAEEVLIKTE